MLAAAFAMQEKHQDDDDDGDGDGDAVDRVTAGFYSSYVFCLSNRGLACCRMCSPPCG
jgi:hypothetical protein